MGRYVMDDIPIPLPAKPARLMDQLRAFMRARHLAYRTEKTYCTWILDYIRYHNRVHPSTLDGAAVDAWLSHLANHRRVAVNTQKTALNAVVFLYKQFLQRDLPDLQFSKASRARRLPTVFTADEAKQVLGHMKDRKSVV